MPGEEDQRHIGAFAVLAEVVERPAHAAEVAVGLQRYLEAEPVEAPAIDWASLTALSSVRTLL